MAKFHHAIKKSKKSRKPKNSNILRHHYRQRLVRLLALKDFEKQNLPQVLTPPQSSDEESSTMSQCSSPIYPVTTKRSLQNRLKPTEPRNRFVSRRTTRKRLRIQCSEDISEEQPAQPQRQNIAQERAMPHFATAYVTGTQMSNFDRNSYAAITSIEERRQYKVEYEQAYEEYYQLIQRIEKLQRDYQLLIDKMHRVLEGSIDYERAKERIAEYYRKNSEQMFQHMHRFHYLHTKLTYICELVTDYDASLTSKSWAARLAAVARDYRQRQQLDFMSTSETRFGTMSREHEHICHNLQPPALRLTVANLKQHDKQQELNGVNLNCQENMNGNSFADWNRTTATCLDNTDSEDDESTVTDSSYSESESQYSESKGTDDETNVTNMDASIVEK